MGSRKKKNKLCMQFVHLYLLQNFPDQEHLRSLAKCLPQTLKSQAYNRNNLLSIENSMKYYHNVRKGHVSGLVLKNKLNSLFENKSTLNEVTISIQYRIPLRDINNQILPVSTHIAFGCVEAAFFQSRNDNRLSFRSRLMMMFTKHGLLPSESSAHFQQ